MKSAASQDESASPKHASIQIDGRIIGRGHEPYLIAELSACHNGSLENALLLIEQAKDAGADAVKIQTYRADTITLDSDRPEFQISGGLWDGYSLYQLYEQAHTPWEWHLQLFNKAREIGITIFSSPFDATAVDLLEELDTPAYKIASFELIDLPLIARVARTGKPVLMSNGMASFEELDEAVSCARDNGATEIAILHCVSGYPAPIEDYNLHTISDIAVKFAVPVGLSDHTLSNVTAVCATSLGGCIVEKHLTLDRNAGGADDKFAIESDEFAALCRDTKLAASALGEVSYGQVDSELTNVQFRRSLFVIKDINPGELLTIENIRSIRPGNGLAPKYLYEVLGKRAVSPLQKGTPLAWNHFEECP